MHISICAPTLTSDLLLTTDICTLIYSGSTHYFLNSSTVSKHQLCTYRTNLIPRQLFDGTTNSVLCSAINLLLHFPSGNKQSVTFYITPLEASYTTVLGHNWLTCYNPLIGRVLGSIKFHSPLQTESLMLPETAAPVPLSSNPPSPPSLTLLLAPKVYFVNAAAIAHLSKMDDAQVYQLFLSNKSTPNNTYPE